MSTSPEKHFIHLSGVGFFFFFFSEVWEKHTGMKCFAVMQISMAKCPRNNHLKKDHNKNNRLQAYITTSVTVFFLGSICFSLSINIAHLDGIQDRVNYHLGMQETSS